jgi:hypothetical protein
VVLDPIDARDVDPQALMERITEIVDGVPGGLDGKIARLQIGNITRETYKNLDHKALRALRAKALHLTLDVTFVSTRGDVTAVAQPGRGLLRDQLLDFSKTWEAPGITSDDIGEVLSAYLSKIEASYEAS